MIISSDAMRADDWVQNFEPQRTL